MTMLHTYGMDNYDNLAEFFQEPLWEDVGNEVWQFSTTGGRFGGGRLFNINLTSTGTWIGIKFIPSKPKTIFFGVSINIAGNASLGDFVRFFSEAVLQHANIAFAGGTTMNVIILGVLEDTFTISTGVWHRLEFKLTVDDTVGEFTIKLDGVEVFSQTGRDTQNGTIAEIGQIRIQVPDTGTASSVSWDDFTFNDDQGTENNDFLGDVRISTLRPNGAGDATAFTPLSGANWENVDETTGPDGDTTYVESLTVGHQDLYNAENFIDGTKVTIHAVTVKAYTKKLEAGSRSLRLLTKSGGVTGVGPNQTVFSTYSYLQQPVELNPNTSNPWTISDVDSIQIGMENV